MQQTETYKLNLIEGGDTFSPQPLNENMEKLEAALGNCTRIAVGAYVGTGTCGANNPNTLTFDFEPAFLLIWSTDMYRCLGSQGNPLSCFYGQYYTGLSASWVGNTVSWYSFSGTADMQMNRSGNKYFYTVIG